MEDEVLVQPSFVMEIFLSFEPEDECPITQEFADKMFFGLFPQFGTKTLPIDGHPDVQVDFLLETIEVIEDGRRARVVLRVPLPEDMD